VGKNSSAIRIASSGCSDERWR